MEYKTQKYQGQLCLSSQILFAISCNSENALIKDLICYYTAIGYMLYMLYIIIIISPVMHQQFKNVLLMMLMKNAAHDVKNLLEQ